MNIGAQMFDWLVDIFLWIFKHTIKLAWNLIKNLITRLMNRKKE